MLVVAVLYLSIPSIAIYQKICASQVETVYCVLLYEVTGLQGKKEIFNNMLMAVAVSPRRGTYIFRHISLHF